MMRMWLVLLVGLSPLSIFADSLVYKSGYTQTLRLYDTEKNSYKKILRKVRDFQVSEKAAAFHDRKGSFFIYDFESKKRHYLGRNVFSFKLTGTTIAFEDVNGRLFCGSSENGFLRLVDSNVRDFQAGSRRVFYIDQQGWLRYFDVRSGRKGVVDEAAVTFQLGSDSLVFKDPGHRLWIARQQFPKKLPLNISAREFYVSEKWLAFIGSSGELELYDLKMKKIVFASNDVKKFLITSNLLVYSMTFGGVVARDLSSSQEHFLGDIKGEWRAVGNLVAYESWGSVMVYDHDLGRAVQLEPFINRYVLGKSGLAFRTTSGALKFYNSDEGETKQLTGNVADFLIGRGSPPVNVYPQKNQDKSSNQTQKENFQALFKALPNPDQAAE
jgi:hypothetical protein